MIELQHIQKTFHAGTPLEVKALQDIHVKLEKGSFNLVIGANGSGKSTLLNLIAGSFLPDSGKVFLGPRDITKLAVHQRSKYIARIFQNPSLGTSPELSLLENFRLASLRTHRKGLIQGISNSFSQVVASHVSILEMGLENRLNQPMMSFSGGQRQALSLLMATFDHVDLLLLDEPTAALDPKSAELVFQLTMKIVREKNLTALMVTHDLKHCLSPVDRILQMEQGRLRRDVSDDELRQLELRDVYTWFL